MRGRALGAAVGVMVATLAAVPVGGTVFVPMSDEDLVAASDVAAVGTVARVASRLLTGGRVVTIVELAVEQALKGAPGDTLVLTEPGGDVAGLLVAVAGAPDYAVGERVLVFARRRADGGLGTTALGLGKYRLEDAPAGPLARRTAAAAATARPLVPFAARVAALAGGGGAAGDGRAGAAVEVPLAEATSGRYAFNPIGGLPGRWFEADCALPVEFSLADADAAQGEPASRAALAAATAAWTAVETASILLAVGPDTTPTPALFNPVQPQHDGRNTVQFDDPFGEVPDLVGCTGVLAMGGFAASTSTDIPDLRGTVGGQTFLKILEGDVTLNDGLGACFPDPALLAEVLAHELGHAIGFGHSSENPAESDPVLADAIMYFRAHDDGRGASIRADDVAGLAEAYPTAAVAGTPLAALACRYGLPLLSVTCFDGTQRVPSTLLARYGKARTAAGRAATAATAKKQKKQLRKAVKMVGRTDKLAAAHLTGACAAGTRATLSALRAGTQAVLAGL